MDDSIGSPILTQKEEEIEGLADLAERDAELSVDVADALVAIHYTPEGDIKKYRPIDMDNLPGNRFRGENEHE
jgi:hypothetical protein